MHKYIYLASQSPRRVQLLNQLGVKHQLLLPDANEDIELLEEQRSNEMPADYVIRVTKLKLDAARKRRLRRKLPEAPILAADTTVALGRRIMGKPEGPAQALEMLQALAGRTHRVMTAVAVSAGVQTFVVRQVSRVKFCDLSLTTIEAYINSGEPAGKAGAYAIQGVAGGWVQHLDGSHSGVMGLPLYDTALLLRRAGLLF